MSSSIKVYCDGPPPATARRAYHSRGRITTFPTYFSQHGSTSWYESRARTRRYAAERAERSRLTLAGTPPPSLTTLPSRPGKFPGALSWIAGGEVIDPVAIIRGEAPVPTATPYQHLTFRCGCGLNLSSRADPVWQVFRILTAQGRDRVNLRELQACLDELAGRSMPQ